MRNTERAEDLFLLGFGGTVSVWLGLKCAPYIGGGLPGIITHFPEISGSPFSFELCPDCLKTVLIFLLAYCLGAVIFMASRKNKRTREEHGSAQWGNVRRLNRKYMQKPPESNKILTNNVSIGLDTKKHGRNLNTMVVGGSGSGKSRRYVLPNLINASDMSYLVLDPKAEIMHATGRLMQSRGYKVRVLDLISMEKSNLYNPLMYIQNDNDVQRLVTNLFKSTTPKNSHTNDPFWDTSAMMLLSALIYYLHYEAPTYEQNFAMILDLLRAGAIKNEDSKRPTPLDNLFYDLRAKDPNHIAVKYYNSYHVGAAKTLMSIQITLASRLEKFNVESLAGMTMTDEMDLASMGEEKTVIYAIIPDNDTSYNFLVSILYMQLFQQLFYCADQKHGGSLPIPVHLLMDEFANIQLPNDFDKILSVMRSRNVFVSIILQNMAQLKALFDKEWESISGNCDEYLFLGGNEQQTHEYVSKMLGKETLDVNSYGKTRGRTGSFATNESTISRELLMPEEVRMLDNRYAILFIRGEKPVIDLKYDLMRHPNIKETVQGGAEPYEHGVVEGDIATISAFNIDGAVYDNTPYRETTFELLSEEDFDEEKNKEKRSLPR